MPVNVRTKKEKEREREKWGARERDKKVKKIEKGRVGEQGNT